MKTSLPRAILRDPACGPGRWRKHDIERVKKKQRMVHVEVEGGVTRGNDLPDDALAMLGIACVLCLLLWIAVQRGF